MKQFNWQKSLFTLIILSVYVFVMYIINKYFGFKPVDFVMVTIITLIAMSAIHISAISSLVLTFIVTLSYGVLSILGVVELFNDTPLNYYYLFIPMSVSITMSLVSLISSFQFSVAVAYDEQLVQLSHVDEVTGFGNTAEFKKNLIDEIERAKRYEHDLSLMLINITSFSTLNQIYGETQGERFLKYYSKFVNQLTRFTDQHYHIDQGLFALILPDTDDNGAKILKERFIEEFQSLNVIIKISRKRVKIEIDIQAAAYDTSKDAEAFYEEVKNELVVEPRGEDE